MSNLFSAFLLVLRRSLANWKLLSSIVVGVLVAVALVSSTPLYSNALNDLGLRHALNQKQTELLDLDIYASNYPIDQQEYQKNSAFVDQQMQGYIGYFIRQKERLVLTQSFNAMVAGRTIPVGANRPRGYFQSYTNLDKHTKLLEGRFPNYSGRVVSPEETAQAATGGAPVHPTDALVPGDLTSPDFQIEALISQETAELFEVGLGDHLIFFSEIWSDAPVQITIRLVGIIEPIDPREEYWFLKTDVFASPSEEGLVAPLFVPEETVFEIVGPMAPLARATFHWYYYTDLTRMNSTNAESIAQTVQLVEHAIATQLSNSALFTLLDSVINEYLEKQLFTQIPLYLLVFQIVGIILYYVITVANMVIEQQAAEIALLRSRGASTFQVFGIFLMEGILISAFGGAVGPFLGAFIFGLLGKTGPFAPLTSGGLLPIRFSTPVFILAGIAAGLCLLAFMVPAIQASRRGVVHYRQQAARPPRTPFWQRFYLDIVLLVIGGGLYYELQQRGTLLTQDIFGELGADPLLLITPLLFMLAVAIVFLRLFPLLVSLAARLGRYVTNPAVILTLRYMARNPIHYGRLILLLMMAASVGMFSASFLGTLNRSYNERVAYAVGTDIRLEELQDYSTGKNALYERYSGISGVEKVSLAYRGSVAVGTFTQVDGILLAIDPATFGQLAWYREDFSSTPLPQIMDILAKDQPTNLGLRLPDGTEAIGLWVSPVYDPNPNQRILVRIEDGRGYYYDIQLGSLEYDDWQYLEGSLVDSSGNLPSPPMTLYCIFLSSATGWAAGIQGLYLDDLQAKGSFSADPVILEDFEDIAEWTARSDVQTSGGMATQTAASDTLSRERSIVHSGTTSGRYTWVTRGTSGYRGIFPNLDARPLLGIASRDFLTGAGLSIGDWVTVRIPGQFLSVSIEDVVDYFPSLDPNRKPFLILNFDRLASMGAQMLGGGNRLYPNEAWLTATPDGEQRQAIVETLESPDYRAKKLYDREELLAAQKADPLVAAGWGGVLLIAFVGVILVSGLGFVVYAYLSARGRHLEFAILRTLGFSLRQIIGLVCFEQIFVIGVGMGIGTVLGHRLSRIMMPFLQLTEKGEMVIPPFVLVTDWLTIGIAYVILTIAFVATISLVVLFFTRVALHRALRMGDE